MRDAAEDALDSAALLGRVKGNVKVLVEILRLCPTELARLLGELETGVARQDARRIHLGAHALKGALGSLSAAHAYEAALRLEHMGRTGNLDRVEEAFRLLQEQVQRVKLAAAKVHSDLTA